MNSAASWAWWRWRMWSEQMVGDIYEPHDAPSRAVQRVGDDEFLVPGDLSVADWMDAFGTKIEANAYDDGRRTAGGQPQAPAQGRRSGAPGTSASLRVESMRGRRVDRVRLKLLANGHNPNEHNAPALPGGGA